MAYDIVQDHTNGRDIVEVSTAEIADATGMRVKVDVGANGCVRAIYSYRHTFQESSKYLDEYELDDVDTKVDTDGTILYKSKNGGWKEKNPFLLDFIEDYGEEKILEKTQKATEEFIKRFANNISSTDYVDMFDENGILLLQIDK